MRDFPYLVLTLGLALGVVVPSIAQTPTPKPPLKQPLSSGGIGTPVPPSSPALGIDLLRATAGAGTVAYVRTGLKPNHYRIGTEPTLSGVTWKTFTEGQTTTTTVNGVAGIQGIIAEPVPAAPQGECPPSSIKIRAFLQFRKTVSISPPQYLLSPIRGDSVCVPFG